MQPTIILSRMDCIIIENDEQCLKQLENFVEQTGELNLKATFSSVDLALKKLTELRPDVVFLNTELEVDAEKLYADQENVLLVLFGLDKSAALKAYDVGAVDYLVKPITVSRFTQTLGKLRKAFEGLKKDSSPVLEIKELFVRSEAKIIKVKLEDLLYIEALADYIIIHVLNGKHIVHSTMKGFIAKLPVSQFCRVHRSYIVSMDKVEAIENNFIVIKNKHIPIGTSYRDLFFDRINLL